jgi:16S rRNA (cytidine1402-2'-O)-methyltransferase
MALFLVATPIGTLADCSPRAREVLGSVSVIAAEDTRVTRRLLSALDIAAPTLISMHGHNEAHLAAGLAERSLTEDVALVSDAGTPGVSDPGARLVAAALALGVEMRSVPGPSALAAAIAVSGFSASPMTFVGFPPRKGRTRWVELVLSHPETVVIYEAPTRIAALVKSLAARAPDREAALCRELSKKFEEVRRAPLGALETEGVRGECVLVIGPGEPLRPPVAAALDPKGLKDVAAWLSTQWACPKRDVYQALLALRAELSESDP